MIERILVSLRGVLATKQSLTTRFLAMLGMTLLFLVLKPLPLKTLSG